LVDLKERTLDEVKAISREDAVEIMRQAGFTGPARIEVDAGSVADRGIDEIVSAVFSLSNAAPHLFAERLPSFESDLRGLLSQASPSGRFAERRREIGVALWRP